MQVCVQSKNAAVQFVFLLYWLREKLQNDAESIQIKLTKKDV